MTMDAFYRLLLARTLHTTTTTTTTTTTKR